MSHDGAGINDCTKSSPKKCGPDYGQDEYGQSYFCVSLNSTNLDAVALVLRGNGLVVYAGDIADAAQELPNVDALIKKDAQGDCPESMMHARCVRGRGPTWGTPAFRADSTRQHIAKVTGLADPT